MDALRAGLLLFGLLLPPLNLPYSVPPTGRDALLGWSAQIGLGTNGAAVPVVLYAMRSAYTAGLLPGDEITRIDGEPADSTALVTVQRTAQAGDTVALMVRRNGATRRVFVPVASNPISNTGYLWYRFLLAVGAWVLGMALVAWRGSRPQVLLLGASLLLMVPISFPSGVPATSAVLATARMVWQVAAGSYRFLVPALLCHFIVLSLPSAGRLRSVKVWGPLYAALFIVLLVATDGLARPMAWADIGPERTVRNWAGLAVQLVAIAAAVAGWRRVRQLPLPVRWVSFAVVVVVGIMALRSILILLLGENADLELLWHANGLVLVLLPATAALFLAAKPERAAEEWRYARQVEYWSSISLTVLYGFAVSGAAAVVLSATGRSLGGMEWLLFGAIFLATLVFSPVLRWAREMVDRRMFARWAEMEAGGRAFVTALGAELEPVRIERRIAAEVPRLLQVSSTTLVLAGELAAAWDLEAGERAAPHDSPAAMLPRPSHRIPWDPAGAIIPISWAHRDEVAALHLGPRLGDRPIESPDRALLQLILQGVSAALQNAATYMELRRAQRGLAEAERIAEIGALAGGLAHEVKNPLAGLKMGLHLLGRDRADTERLQRLHRDVERIDDLITGLLRFAQDGAAPAMQPLDLKRHAVAAVTELRALAADRGVTIGEEYPDEEVITLATAAQLRIILTNLLMNALDATPHGGTVTVGIACLQESVELRVQDTGPGIPAELRGRLFDLGFSTRPQGSGLGLALTRREVERLGGEIEVDAPAHGGTVLRVRLPRLI